jgi:hypothetical protein
MKRASVALQALVAPALLAVVTPSTDPAAASVCVANGARSPVLRVNRGGTAEVRWETPAGKRRYGIIRPGGFCLDRGARMSGRDVSQRASRVAIPFPRVVKRTPDGRLWALQAWRRRPDGPRELRFSRWTGQPPRLTARTTCCHRNRRVLRGRVIYHRRPVAQAIVYIDCFACATRPRRWTRIAERRTGQSGRFELIIRPKWRGESYRATLLGPNFGWVRAPDMRQVAGSPRRERNVRAPLHLRGTSPNARKVLRRISHPGRALRGPLALDERTQQEKRSRPSPARSAGPTGRSAGS